MKAETYKKLKELEKPMVIAATCGYIRMTAPQVALLAECYEEAFGKALTRSQKTCGHCLKKAAVDLYNDFIKYEKSPSGKHIDKEENADTEQTE